MSGFEIAGIVLGGFPILIEGLKFYAEERGVIKDFYHCQPLIQSLFRQIKREKVTFENSAKCLLNAASKQSDRAPSEVLEMMNSPDDERWEEEDSDSDGIFSRRTASMFSETRKDLEDVLAKIQSTIEKVPPRDPKKHTTKRQWERLLLAVKQDQVEAQLARAENLNRFLVNFTREDVIANGSGTKKRSSKHHNAIRTHALVIADALRKKLLGKDCLCGMRHSANLVIDMPATRKKFQMPNFRVLFGFDGPSSEAAPLTGTNLEMDILVIEELATADASMTKLIPENAKSEVLTVKEIVAEDIEGKKRRVRDIFRSRSSNSQQRGDQTTKATTPISSKSKAQRQVAFVDVRDGEQTDTQAEIDDLCTEIMSTKGQDSWYGVLARKLDSRHEIRRAKAPYFPPQYLKVVSLADLLSSKIWRIQSRSRLGLQLASSVLQFYQTPWLPENWGKNDILFIQDIDGRVLIERPFLKPHFMAGITSGVPTINKNIPYLFALGVLLLELHYKTPIEELQKNQGLTSERNELPEVRQMKKTLLVLQLIEEMDEGANLKNAIKQCINGPDGALTDLNREELRDMVEEKIVLPLEEQLLWVHHCKKLEDCM